MKRKRERKKRKKKKSVNYLSKNIYIKEPKFNKYCIILYVRKERKL